MKTSPGSQPRARLTKRRVGRKPRKSLLSDSTSDGDIEKGKVRINGETVDIESITDEQLYALRKVLPRKEYRYLLWTKISRLLKNRKSARKSRKRRKAELTSLKEEIALLKKENEALKQKIQTYESAA